MSYSLGGTNIKRPASMIVTTVSQYAEQKTLDASVGRDYMGDDKAVFILTYENLTDSDYQTIKTIYNTYRTSGVQAFDTTGEQAVYSVNVHIDLGDREFAVSGSDYLSNFTLTLKEA